MKFRLALAVALSCAALSATAKSWRQDGWTLVVRTDRFTRQIDCKVSHRRLLGADVVVGRSAADFRFDPRLDTSGAWFQVDGQPARPWRDVVAKLVAAGAMARAEHLDNETAGVVRLPLDELAGASTVTIRPIVHSRPRRFSLGGLWPVLQQAQARGCPK